MTKPERLTVAWMRKIDAKIDAVTGELRAVIERLDRIQDELMVSSAICLRIEAREVEGKGLLALYQRLQTGQRRMEERVAALEAQPEPG